MGLILSSKDKMAILIKNKIHNSKHKVKDKRKKQLITKNQLQVKFQLMIPNKMI